MKSSAVIVVVCLGVCGPVLAENPRVNGNATIRGQYAGSEIVITTTDRLAGAIHSLTWNGKEFIDSADHGRQLQSACSFDAGVKKPFWAERYNPTEAGSRLDGAGRISTSRLLELKADKSELQTRTRMAFWLAPGEKSDGKPALNTKTLSDHIVAKHVKIGTTAAANVIDYSVTYTVPHGEAHTFAQFEALTGYMPPEFGKFWKLVAPGKLEALTDGPGEQEHPVVFSNEKGTHAMGIFSPQTTPRPGYGRFRFKSEKVVKWNCVFRVRNENGIEPGEYAFRMSVVVGTREDVSKTLTVLMENAAKK